MTAVSPSLPHAAPQESAPDAHVATNSSATRAKLHALTSLRFFAAAMVVLTHSRGLFGISEYPWWTDMTAPGVSFFFILSGFILTYVYPSFEGKPTGVRRFWLARFARIWPAHISAFLLFCVLIPISFIRQYYPPLSALLNVLLLQAWVPTAHYLGAFNNASWSLSVEVFFYLSFPLLIRYLRSAWAGMLIAAFALSGAIAVIANGNIVPLPSSVNHIYLAVLTPPPRLFEFVLGMSTALAWRRFAPRLRLALGRTMGTIIEVCAVALVLTVLVVGPRVAHALRGHGWISETVETWLIFIVVSALPIALLIFIMALERGGVSYLLSLPVLVLLGEISYSVYLFHDVLIASYHYFHPGITLLLPNWFAYTSFWLITLVTAYAVWALIEIPCRRFLVGLWPSRSVGRAENHSATKAKPRGTLFTPTWRYGVGASALLLLPIAYIAFTSMAPPLDRAARADGEILANVETINGSLFSQDGPMVMTLGDAQKSSISISGWAAPPEGDNPIRGVFVSIDRHSDVWSTYGVLRPDVTHYFTERHYPQLGRFIQSGFTSKIPISMLPPGTHTITIKLLRRGSRTYFESRPFTLTITPSTHDTVA